MAKKKFSRKQLAAQRLFAARAKAGTLFKKKSRKKTRTATPKKKKSSTKSTVARRKSSGRKGGTTMQTRIKKLAMGAGIGVGVGLLATALRRPEINQAAPIVDAFAGAGVEGQIGTAAVRVVQQMIARGGLSLNGNGGRVPGGTRFEGA